MESNTDYNPTPTLRRRDFLAYGAGVALLPTISWAARERCDGLAIGYCDQNPELDEPAAPLIVAADRLAAGDPRLARHGAQVTVHGLLGPADGLRPLGIRSAELLVGFPAAGGRRADVEFRAWSHQLLPVENAGSPVRFTVPADRGLALALEVETLGSERFETLLVTGREPGTAKLRAGHYLIAPGATEFRARRFDPARAEPLLSLSVEPAVD